MSLLALLVLSTALSAAPPKQTLDCDPYTCKLFDAPKQAFAVVLESKPMVLGIGEYHEIESGARVKSSLKRFTETLLPLLKGRTTDLVAETWITNGKCGKVEKAATQQIEKETERPATTEDEVVTMLKKASSMGIEPHILTVECEDYEDLLDKDGEVDNVKLLGLVTRLLKEKAIKLAGVDREPPQTPAPEREPARSVVIYGGALHNDLTPPEELADFSFAKDLRKATAGRYVQLGLYVPEFIERDDEAKKSPWYPLFEKYVSATKTLLITLSPDAHLIFFPRSPKPVVSKSPPPKR